MVPTGAEQMIAHRGIEELCAARPSISLPSCSARPSQRSYPRSTPAPSRAGHGVNCRRRLRASTMVSTQTRSIVAVESPNNRQGEPLSSQVRSSPFSFCSAVQERSRRRTSAHAGAERHSLRGFHFSRAAHSSCFPPRYPCGHLSRLDWVRRWHLA